MVQWREVSMRDAIRFIRDGDGQPTDNQQGPSPPEYGAAVEWFDNGTAVACKSEWYGPYSEVTPDVDAEPPRWWVERRARGWGWGRQDGPMPEIADDEA